MALLPPATSSTLPLVSVIIPVKNAGAFLTDALRSVVAQRHRPIEVCAYDDGSTDGSLSELLRFRDEAAQSSPEVRVWVGSTVWDSVPAISDRSVNDPPQREQEPPPPSGRDENVQKCGPGHARNCAVAASRGEFLCLLDADDTMVPERVGRQLSYLLSLPEAERCAVLLGAQFYREPAGSTPRYVDWANRLTEAELMLQRFRECTIIQPTWFMHRAVFDRVGGWRAEPNSEDLMFMYAHVEAGGELRRCPGGPLVMYRYHGAQTSHGVRRQRMFAVRAAAFERQVLHRPGRFYHPMWESFSVWGAGRDGKDFFKALSRESQARVLRFYDLDPQRIGKPYVNTADPPALRRPVPVVHRDEMRPPVVSCVALDRYEEYEAHLRELSMSPGHDFYQFS